MSGHPTPLAPGDNTPRIMRATGAVSHTGPSGQHPHHRGHEEGNGREPPQPLSASAAVIPGGDDRGRHREVGEAPGWAGVDGAGRGARVRLDP